MARQRWLLCCWPGLAELWVQGSWSALAQACGFTALLNGALAVTLVWTELVSPELRFAWWTSVALMWLLGIWSAWRCLQSGPDARGDLFSHAMGEYLQGNWFAAEAVLEQLVKADARDIEAQLLLATLFRRTGRLAEARAALDRLSRSYGSQKWELEIGREQELVQSALASPASPQSISTADLATNTARAA